MRRVRRQIFKYVIFQNATAGNPVSASDVYRLIGMPYAENGAPTVENMQFTYVDVDTFCHGMEVDEQERINYKNLINAMFEVRNVAPYDIARSKTNNDVIKISISDVEKFRAFAENIVERIPISYHSYGYVLRYFAELHKIVRLFESSRDKAKSMLDGLTPLYKYGSYKEMIVQTTGPNFTTGLAGDLLYPEVYAGAWRTPDERLKLAGVALPRGNAGADEEALLETFKTNLQDYQNLILLVHFARRFGENHPFNLFIKAKLIAEFPYTSITLKNMLAANFAFTTRDRVSPPRLSVVESAASLRRSLPNTLYVLKKDDQTLDYAYSDDKNQIKNGTFDIATEDELKYAIYDIEDQIREKAAQLGILGKVLKGVLPEQWRRETAEIMQSPGSQYPELVKILKDYNLTAPSLVDIIDGIK